MHCPARALCIPVMIQCFVSRPNIIATLDNTSPFWAWQAAAPLLGEHGPFVQRYSRMDRLDRGAMHKATSVLPLALRLRRAPCTLPEAWGMPPRAGGRAGDWARGKQGNRGGKTLRGEQRGKIPKTALGSFRASLKRAGQGCPGVPGVAAPAAARGDLSALPGVCAGSSRGLHSKQHGNEHSKIQGELLVWESETQHFADTTWDAGHKEGSVVPCKKLCEAIQFIDIERHGKLSLEVSLESG